MKANRNGKIKGLNANDTAFVLANIARHVALTPEEQDRFLSVTETVVLKNKQFLLQTGEVNRHQHFVIHGCLRTFSTDGQGRDHIVLFAPENWWCGDLFSYLSGTPARYAIQALEASLLLRISKTDLESLYPDVPKFERFFRELYQNAFVLYQNRINNTLSASAADRYKQFESVYPGLSQRIAAKYIAEYIGVTPEFFSQMKRS